MEKCESKNVGLGFKVESSLLPLSGTLRTWALLTLNNDRDVKLGNNGFIIRNPPLC